MFQYFQSLKDYFKLCGDKARIDNEFCKFHYRYTTTILLACCILVGTKEIFGHDIKCDKTNLGVSEDYLNQYCYYQYVYTVVNKTDHGQPLMENLLGMGHVKEGYEKRYHAYYQWVATTLFLQALVFYLPHFFWKKVEGGRIKTLVDGLELAKYSYGDEDISGKSVNIPSKATVSKKLDVIKKDIVLRFHTSSSWSLGLVAYELVNLVNVMLQVYLTNVFLDGLFMRIGYVAAEPNFLVHDILYQPMSKIFPKLVSCDYASGGGTGATQNSSHMCVLQQNNTNDKIYTALWYWYITLFIVSIGGVTWRLLTMLVFKTRWFNRSQFNRRDNPPQLYQVAELCNFSDWLFLSYLHKNTSRVIFNEIVTSVAEELTDLHSNASSTSSRRPTGFDHDTLPLEKKNIYPV